VPRADGVVVGATQYEHGRDTAPAVSGVRELLDDACAVVPALGEYELAECAAGLRPMTPDNLPLVGRLDKRTLVATGHGRSGFLLAPWTAEAIVAELDGAPLPDAEAIAGAQGFPGSSPATGERSQRFGAQQVMR
jgi:glycine oxidase